MADLIIQQNPFRPTVNRKLYLAMDGKSIHRNVHRHGLFTNGKRNCPFIVLLNGKPILQKDWNHIVKPNDHVLIQHLPAGGGGSNPLQIIGMIAIMAASVFTYGATLPALGAYGAAAAAAAVSIGGSMLLNMMFRTSATSLGTTASDAASSTYSIQSQGNSAKLLSPIPVIYGRMKMTPDFASQPYTEYNGNDQYLYELLAITQGECNIEQILINGNDSSSYSDVTIQKIEPYGQVTLFPTNVETSSSVSGQQMYGPNETGFAILGPFVTSDPGTTANFIGVDIAVNAGLYKLNQSTGKKQATSVRYLFEYQQINDAGTPTGNWTTLVDNTITGSSADAVRITHKIAVPAARYQVRGQRITNADTSGTVSEALTWQNLRAYLTAPTNFGNVTLLAIVMKATNQLTSGTAVEVVTTRKLQTWDPVNGWSVGTTPTRSIAWAAADCLRNSTYGRGLVDSKYNLRMLYQLDQTWAARGDTFNYVFDQAVQLWTALQTILKAGRTIPIYYAGLIDFIRNAPQAMNKRVFTPDEMVKNSFSTTYQFAEVDTPDYVTIQFHNEDTWSDDTVDCVLPGGTSDVQSLVVLDGVTNRDQAWREGITMAAINKLQRRIINFDCQMDGVLPQYNDLCGISHDAPGWGYSGKVESLNTGTGEVVLTNDVVFDAQASHVIAFRKKDGTADGPYACVPSSSGYANQVRLTGLTSAQMQLIYISDGSHDDPTSFQFGPLNAESLPAVLYSGTPKNDGTVSLQLVNYDPNIFAAETGGIIPDPPNYSTLPTSKGQAALPIIDTVTIQYTYTVGVQLIVASVAAGAQSYQFRYSADNGLTWVDLGASVSPQMQVSLAAGTYLIRVRAVGTAAGPWTTITATVALTSLPLVAIAAFTATPIVFGVTLQWVIAANNGGIAKAVEIWQSTTNILGNANLLVRLDASATSYTHSGMGPAEQHYYWIRCIDQADRNGPWFNNGVGTPGESSDDVTAILDYLGGEIDETMLSQELQTKIDTTAALANTNQQAIATTNTTVSGLSARVDTLTTNVNGNATQISQISTDLAAMITFKAQGNDSSGNPILAGVAIGVEGGTSRIILMANQVAICDPANVNTQKYPFIVSGGVIYMDTAMIANGSITNAKIANATITQAQMANASIGNAQIQSAAVQQANIANASIVNAHIQDLQVDTFKLGYNAATSAASFSGSTSVSGTYNSAGGQLAVFVSITGSNGSSPLLTVNFSGQAISVSAAAGFTAMRLMQPAAGGVGFSTSVTQQVTSCAVVVLEFKR